MHKDIEYVMEYLAPKFSTHLLFPSAKFPEYKQVQSYLRACQKRGLIPLRVELCLADTALSLAGTVDMVWAWPVDSSFAFDAATGKRRVILADWKRTKKLHDDAFRGACGLGPMRGFPASNASKYGLQLGIYRHLVELNLDMVVVDLEIVAFHPECHNYMLVQPAITRAHVGEVLGRWEAQVVAGKTKFTADLAQMRA